MTMYYGVLLQYLLIRNSNQIYTAIYLTNALIKGRMHQLMQRPGSSLFKKKKLRATLQLYISVGDCVLINAPTIILFLHQRMTLTGHWT
jgi:hypothetical protein